MINKAQCNKRRKKIYFFFLLFLLFLLGISLFLYNGFWFLQGYFLSNHIEEIVFKPSTTLMHSEENLLQKKKIPLYPNRPEIGESYAILLIPRLNESLPIYYGVEDDQLRNGVGQVVRTTLPGEGNNTILSGHRDTVFRNLGKLEIGDTLVVQTIAGEFTYKITKTNIVDKNDRTVISPKPKDTLTVITCYPFYFMGPAPERYVISAELISQKK